MAYCQYLWGIKVLILSGLSVLAPTFHYNVMSVKFLHALLLLLTIFVCFYCISLIFFNTLSAIICFVVCSRCSSIRELIHGKKTVRLMIWDVQIRLFLTNADYREAYRRNYKIIPIFA